VRLLSDRFVLAMPAPPGEPFNAPRSLADVADQPFVWFDAQRSAAHRFLIAQCERAGFTPRIAQVGSDIPTLIGLVAAGMGCAFVPHRGADVSAHGPARRARRAGEPLRHRVRVRRRGRAGVSRRRAVSRSRARSGRPGGLSASAHGSRTRRRSFGRQAASLPPRPASRPSRTKHFSTPTKILSNT
jgi:DNA-binding transcriptional LysR family regulator